jgi:hypothetical protein
MEEQNRKIIYVDEALFSKTTLKKFAWRGKGDSLNAFASKQ